MGVAFSIGGLALAHASTDEIGAEEFGETTGGIVGSCSNRFQPTKVFRAEESVWDLPNFERGRAIEQALGTNLPHKYPVIDIFDNGGVAKSIKSLDLRSSKYQSLETLHDTLVGYVDKLAVFPGKGARGAVPSTIGAMSDRVLVVAIPPRTTTAAQEGVFGEVVEYGRQKGVTVQVVEFE